MLEDAGLVLFADTRAVKIFAREILGVVREVALLPSVAIVGEVELAKVLRKIDGLRFTLVESLPLSLGVKLVLRLLLMELTIILCLLDLLLFLACFFIFFGGTLL